MTATKNKRDLPGLLFLYKHINMQNIFISKMIFAAAYSYCVYRFVITPNIFLIKKHYKFKKRGIKTMGTVIENNPTISRTTDIAFQQLVQYVVDGRNYYLEKEVNSSPVLPIGAKVEVHYDENNLSNALITKPSSNGAPYFMIFFMLLVTAFIFITVFSTSLPGSTVSVSP